MRFKHFFHLLMFICLITSAIGCQYGNMTAKIHLAHPNTDVATTYKKTLKRFDSLEKTGKLDPAAITSRLNQSYQESTRIRAAATVTTGPEAVTPETPTLPNGDSTVLSSPTFSGSAGAVGLDSSISPFSLITQTRDIYESLVTAELRFKFDELRKDGYRFYHVPITLAIHPNFRTKKNFIAELSFKVKTEVKPKKDDKGNVTTTFTPDETEQAKFIGSWKNLLLINKKQNISQIENVFKNVYQDAKTAFEKPENIQVFTISPLRQFSYQAQSLARRIQRMEAFQGSGSGPIAEGAAGAANLGLDRIRRMEKDFATLAQQPILTGFIDSNSFGWRCYPTTVVDEKGKNTVETLKPGPRDVHVILAVKTITNKTKKEFERVLGETPLQVGEIPLPVPDDELKLKCDYNWISTRNFSRFFSPGDKEGNLGDLSVVISERKKPIDLKAEIVGDNPSSTADKHKVTFAATDKAKIVQIEGTGFSKDTKVIFNSLSLTPDNFTKDRLFVLIKSEYATNGKPDYTIKLTDGPGRNTVAKGVININKPADKRIASISISSGNTNVTPGTLILLTYKDPSRVPPTEMLPMDSVKSIYVGNIKVPDDNISLFNAKRGLFGFTAPPLTDGSGLANPILVSIGIGTTPAVKFKVDKYIYYVATQKKVDLSLIRNMQ